MPNEINNNGLQGVNNGGLANVQVVNNIADPLPLPDFFFDEDIEEDDGLEEITNDELQAFADQLAEDENLELIPDQLIEEKVEEKKIIHQNIKLHKGGIANSSVCVQTTCGRWFLKDDKDVKLDIIDGRSIYIGHAIPVVAHFLEDGSPNRDNYEFTSENNQGKLTHLVFETVIKGLNDNKPMQGVEYTIYDLLPKDKYNECYLDGKFYHYNTQIPKKLKKPAQYRKVNCIKRQFMQSKPWAERVELTTEQQFKYGLKSPSFNRTEGKKYTFGVELETISGILPPHLDKELNYEAVHDGSLKDPKTGEILGAEYVSGVLTGDTGFLQLKRLCNELAKRCKIDKKCGMHIHIGGINFNKQTIVYMYKLFQMIEHDIFSMLPPSRRDNEYCRPLKQIPLDFKETDFTNPLEYELLIEEYHNKIMEFLASGSLTPKVSKKFDHPLGHKCNYKHETARYCWANFVPAVFNTRKNGIYTIEVRNHPGTTSYEKCKYWTLICMGLVWFVENHFREIALNKDINLKYIMDKAYPKQGAKINNYIDKRVLKFNSDEAPLNEQEEYEETLGDESLSIKSI